MESGDGPDKEEERGRPVGPPKVPVSCCSVRSGSSMSIWETESGARPRATFITGHGTSGPGGMVEEGIYMDEPLGVLVSWAQLNMPLAFAPVSVPKIAVLPCTMTSEICRDISTALLYVSWCSLSGSISC